LHGNDNPKSCLEDAKLELFKIEDSSIQDLLDCFNSIHTLQEYELPVADKDNRGYVLIALTYALYTFVNEMSYKDAMRLILSKGGDTDTNCCIAGYIIGARFGIGGDKGIPEEYVEKVLDVDPSIKGVGRSRPRMFIPKYQLEESFKKLISSMFSIKI